jgi:transcription antitermination factor NusA-like protein
MATIDMQTMRYINLLDRTSNVKTTKCFNYNNAVVFAVPKNMLSRAIGPGASNLRRIQDSVGKRVKVVEDIRDIEKAKKFVEAIVSPVTFKSLEVKEGSFILTAGSQSKAALIGRNRRRFDELKMILFNTFGKDLKIL